MARDPEEQLALRSTLLLPLLAAGLTPVMSLARLWTLLAGTRAVVLKMDLMPPDGVQLLVTL